MEFRDLISLEKARKRLEKNLEPKIRKKNIEECHNLILAENVYSEVDVPGFDRAAMDGYAVKASDTYGAEEDNPIVLERVGELMPGEVKNIEISEGEAVEVATGALLPKGANAVVMIEFIDEENGEIYLRNSAAPDNNIMSAGSDILAGEKVLSKGEKLNPRDIGVLASIGIEEVEVYYPDIEVGILSIGEELVSPGKKLDKGEIYDTNSYSIGTALEELNISPNYYGIVRDDLEKIKKKIKKAIKENDVVLTSGSTSAGSCDLLHKALETELLFHGVAIKPGKPTLAAKKNGTLLIGLPGYPTSALTIFNLLVDPLLRKIIGKKVEKKEVLAEAATKIRSTSGRRHFHPIGLVKRKDKYYSYPIEKGSGAITSLSQADGFLEIDEDEHFVKEGEERRVRVFSEEIELTDLLFMGSHSIGIDLIRNNIDVSSKSINVGSSGGFRLMNKGIPDISGAHLLSKDGEYNLPFMEKFDLKDVHLIKGYLREQGIFVEGGNPHNISNISDLLDKPVKLMNRNKGSGTRRLLDLKLNELEKQTKMSLDKIKEKIDGYNTSSKTHSGVASAIKLGKADVGLGTKFFANQKDIDFIPISEEEYDFLINDKSYQDKSVRKFLKYLRSDEFKEELDKITGIRSYSETGREIYP